MRTTARELIDQGPVLSVGVVSADLLHLGEQVDALGGAGISLLHVDVMDGVFCPMTTVGLPMVRALPDRYVKDVHLMVDEPVEKLQAYVEAGAGILSFHVEATKHAHRGLQSLAGSGVLRGIALNPGTPLTALEPLLEEVEFVLLLAVNPGYGGQTFIGSTQRRVLELRDRLHSRGIAIGVDGGITIDNVEDVAGLGVDLIVAGSAVFARGDPASGAAAMLAAIVRGRGE